MNRKMLLGVCMAACLAGVSGCGSKTSGAGEAAVRQSEVPGSEESKENEADVAGQGFRPPEGSHIDKNGNIVDKEGNTFDKDGGWQVPEGGYVDSSGRVYDQNGNLMGGGAKIGSKG